MTGGFNSDDSSTGSLNEPSPPQVGINDSEHAEGGILADTDNVYNDPSMKNDQPKDEDEAMDDADANDDGDNHLMLYQLEQNDITKSALTCDAAPVLYTRHSFYRQTRKRGKILKQVQEVYLREDLGYGHYYVEDEDTATVDGKSTVLHAQVERVVGKPTVIETLQQLRSVLVANKAVKAGSVSALQLLVLDTNVLLHHWDVIDQASKQGILPNVVIPQTALEECRAQKRAAYEKVVEWMRVVDVKTNNDDENVATKNPARLFIADSHHVAIADASNTIESSKDTATVPVNDRNDARLRRVAQFYAQSLLDNDEAETSMVDTTDKSDDNVSVVFLTDDANSRKQAEADASSLYKSMSVRAWVTQLEKDFVDSISTDILDRVAQFEVDTSGKDTRSQRFYPQHLSSSDVTLGVQKGQYYRGVYRGDMNSGVVNVRLGSDRIMLSLSGHEDCNRALDGDVVAVALHPVSQWNRVGQSDGTMSDGKFGDSCGIAAETADVRESELSNVPDSLDKDGVDLRPTGRIVGIIRRNFGVYSGSILQITSVESEQDKLITEHEREHMDGSITCVFYPVNRKTPPVLIRTTQRERLWGQRIVVAIDSWPANSKLPLGHYVRTIGPVGSKDVETEVLLQEHNIPYEPFSADVLACLPPESYQISFDNSPGRKDLRHLPVLSIDPPGCKDIDDALHCIELPNGNWQVGVHIADVTHYVKAGTAIDLEAANRSTSTYLVNKRLDMLPGLLTTDLCSLKGNVDRYAFSVLWEVTPDADIVKVDFHKTLIHSIAALTYQQAQIMIEMPDNTDDIQACAVKRLASLARKFRKRRIDAGALTLASPEVKFSLDSESLNPTDVQAYTLVEANAVVEEFMLLANVTVSKKILRHYPTLSVLRRHPAPNRSMFDSLISKAQCKSITITIDDSKKLADSLDAAIVADDPYVNKLLRILSTRCMSPAQYFCSGEFRPTEWHHYGLAAPVYTHFTSPIRRYADVCVHRLLAGAIGVAPLPAHLSSKSYLHDLCANMNRRHRSAQMAGRASVQLHTLIFFSEKGPTEDDAYVLDVETAQNSKPSFTVIIPRYGLEGRVKLSWDDQYITRIPEKHKLVYSDGNKRTTTVQVFDKVRVRIWIKEYPDHRLELVLDMADDGTNKTSAESTDDDKPMKESTASVDTEAKHPSPRKKRRVKK